MSFIRSRRRLLAVLAAVLLLAAACSDDPDAATVEGGDSLSADDVEEMVGDNEVATDGEAAAVGDESLTGAGVAEMVDRPGAGTIDRVEAAEAITNWVRNELWYASLAAEGFDDFQPYLDDARAEFQAFLDTNPDADLPGIDSAAGYELIRAQALAGLVTDYMLEVEEIEIQWPEQLCSSHILLETEEDALAAIERLDAGEDFAELAMELSTGPTGESGGDLGCVDPASFVQEFVDGAAALGGPGITPPVESEFGWHVIEVRSFDASPSDDPIDIQNAVLASPEFLAFQQEVIEREVTVDPRYGEWDTLSAAVVPAAG